MPVRYAHPQALPSIDWNRVPAYSSRIAAARTDQSLPSAARTEGTRGRILMAALDRFAEHGYEATSIREIAADLQLNSATLYSHFVSKEAILAELVLLGHETHHQRLMAAVLSTTGGPLDQLMAFTRAHVLMHCEYPRLAVVANVELHSLSTATAAPVFALRNQSFATLIGILERGQSAGVFDLVHVGATGAAIAALGVQAAHWYPSPAVQLEANALADAYCVMVARMAGVTKEE